MRGYITDFVPWSKTYCFQMDRHDCYLRLQGRCSLTARNMLKDSDSVVADNSLLFCPNLASSIMLNGFKQASDDVWIHKKICGHYEIAQGQHRVCVCARLKIPMKVYFQEDDDLCTVCNFCKHDFRKKISYYLLREHEFLLKL